jgi:hypothetical protein
MVVQVRHEMFAWLVREMAATCIAAGGENNVSISMAAAADDHEYAGWTFEIHVTRPGKVTPMQQARERGAEIASLRLAFVDQQKWLRRWDPELSPRVDCRIEVLRRVGVICGGDWPDYIEDLTA